MCRFSAFTIRSGAYKHSCFWVRERRENNILLDIQPHRNTDIYINLENTSRGAASGGRGALGAGGVEGGSIVAKLNGEEGDGGQLGRD